MTETFTVATDAELHRSVCGKYGEMVYFLHAPSVGKVKIGTSYRPAQRFAEIQACSPVPLHFIGCVPGGADVEARWHRWAERERSHGEWFDCSDALLNKMEAADLARRFSELSDDGKDAFLALASAHGSGPIPDSALFPEITATTAVKVKARGA